jgi:excisionase family DNA binding protein
MTDLHVPDPNVFDYKEIPAAIAQLSGLCTQLAMRLITEGRNPEEVEEDILLTPDEAAVLLHHSKSWVYQHVKKLPFTKHIGVKLLFSKKGLMAWQARQK